MAFSLDELLDATGIKEMDSSRFNKTASAGDETDFAKLAAECRQAADATPSEVVQADNQELVEKTAAIAIIEKTLSEIHEIEGGSPEAIKTASVARQNSGHAAFIKSALEQGHSPEDIAKFLEAKRRDGEDGQARKSATTIIS